MTEPFRAVSTRGLDYLGGGRDDDGPWLLYADPADPAGPPLLVVAARVVWVWRDRKGAAGLYRPFLTLPEAAGAEPA